MAQPPLTAAIKKVEEELGVILLERTNRVARLTRPGEIFLEQARRTLLQAETAVRITRRAAAGLIGSLRVTFVASASRDLLPDVLLAFRKNHPDVELELIEATTMQQVKSLLEGRADIGFVVPPLAEVEGLQIEPLTEDHLIAALPVGHRLAQRKRLKLRDLATEPWILFPARQGPGLHSRILASCAQAGFVPDIRQEAIQMETIVNLVGCGLGVAVVPSSFKDSERKVVFATISGPGTPVVYTRAIVYKTSSPVLDAFIKTVRNRRRLKLGRTTHDKSLDA
jgi:DNA-binding transcriptional LysR family regulator